AGADGAARVSVEDGEPRVGEREHLEPRRRAVREMWPAVDLQDEAAAATRARADEPGVEVVPFLVADGVVLRVAAIRREPAAAVPRQAAAGAGVEEVAGDREPELAVELLAEAA